jgi:hypothetical protein
VVATAVLGLGFAACAIPTDESGELTLRLVDPPRGVLVGDTVRLAVQVDGGGVSASGADLRVTSSDPDILLVDGTGLLTAVREGAVDVEVRLARFESAAPVVHRLYVSRGIIIARYSGAATGDTILRYGETLVVEGLRLDPDSLASASIADAPAEIMGYRPADPADPESLEELRILVPVIRGGGQLVLVHRNGGSGSRLIRTVDQDVWDLQTDPITIDLAQGDFLGSYLTVEFPQVDVFRFQVPAGEWTVSLTLLNEFALAPPFFLTLSEDGQYDFPAWGRSHASYACGTSGDFSGFWGAAPSRPIGEAVMPFRFEEPRIVSIRLTTESDFTFPYRLLFREGYDSELIPDVAEGNDFCDQPYPLTLGVGGSFNFDTTVDHDWYSVTIPGAPVDFRPLRQLGEGADNDTFETALEIRPGDRVVGDRDRPGDLDVYRVELAAGQVVDVEILGAELAEVLPGRVERSDMRVDARLYGPDGTILTYAGYARTVPAFERDQQPLRTADAWIRHPVEQTGTYWITVSGTGRFVGQDDFGPHMYYQMDVRSTDQARKLRIQATGPETDADLTLIEMRDFGPNQTLVQVRNDGSVESISEWVFPGRYLLLANPRNVTAGPYDLQVDLDGPGGTP